MQILRALLYSVGLFAGLVLLSLLVAGIMMVMYGIIHKKGKKPQESNEAKAAAAGKVG
jgi:cell division protein FtsN